MGGGTVDGPSELLDCGSVSVGTVLIANVDEGMLGVGARPGKSARLLSGTLSWPAGAEDTNGSSVRGRVEWRGGGNCAWGDFGGSNAQEGTAEFGEMRRAKGLGSSQVLLGEVEAVGCIGV